MESINVLIEDGNVSIKQECSNENFMLAASVIFSSMAQGSDNTLEELLDILKKNTLSIMEASSLTRKDKDTKNELQ